MPSKTSSSITVDAPAADIMDVIADLEAYPEWTSSVKSVDVLSAFDDGRPREATFQLDAGPIKDTYTLAYEWNAAESVHWNLVEGSLIKTLNGSYSLVSTETGAEVTYNLEVDVAIPLLGLMKRKAEKVIIDTALKELKKRVEGSS